MAHDISTYDLSRRSLFASGAAAITAGVFSLAFPRIAQATELSDTIAEQERVANEIVKKRLELETYTDNYYKTVEQHESALIAVEKAQTKIDANTVLIESLQEKLMERVEARYRSDEMGMYDVLLESADFTEFATRWAAIERLNAADAALVEKIKTLRDENMAEKAELESQEEIAQLKQDEAKLIEEQCRQRISELELMLEKLSAQAEELIRRDQEEALSRAMDSSKVSIIGNPRNIPSTPEVVPIARAQIGKPYVWGAKGPASFDCSGLVGWCYAQLGIGVPSYTESLYALALAAGAVLPLSQVEPGDVLYRPGHVGIAAHKGGVPYIHAPESGALVRDTDSLSYCGFVCGLRFPRDIKATFISTNAKDYAEKIESTLPNNLNSISSSTGTTLSDDADELDATQAENLVTIPEEDEY